jgi:hypothetical protein
MTNILQNFCHTMLNPTKKTSLICTILILVRLGQFDRVQP